MELLGGAFPLELHSSAFHHHYNAAASPPPPLKLGGGGGGGSRESTTKKKILFQSRQKEILKMRPLNVIVSGGQYSSLKTARGT